MECRAATDRRQTGRQWALVKAWLLALTASFVLAVPTVRTGELNELGSAKERVEDVSLMTRVVGKRQTCLSGRRVAIMFSTSIQARLGRDFLPEPPAVVGHRLPNGLLAPMMC